MLTRPAPDIKTTDVYNAFGLNIASEIPLLDMETIQGVPDVIIKYGDIPDTLADAVIKGVRYEASPDTFLLKLDGIAGYHVTQGRRIVVQAAPAAVPEEILLFLMGSVMGALLHQRNILPLHAGAVLTDQGAVILAGPSGIGKSTLTAVFQQQGFPILADDVCAVSAEKKNGVKVLPGFPRLKLWADALKKLETSPEGLKQVRQAPDLNKYFIPFNSRANSPAPIRSIFILQSTHSDEFDIETLVGMKRIQPILKNTYRPEILEEMGTKQDHFRQCAALADTVPVFRLSRPQKGFRLGELMNFVKRHW
ncbi:hypothetical protein [Desulfobacter latus]|uniref:Serine kinase n=1 Tax=Desulfobacter latus TaxID=2292 RepID=A0A850SVF3_9BACT|nr:hypothetical protein [Desulfobacter latus]NWH03403.1 hypothetical protein [Desulfobacter latus]